MKKLTVKNIIVEYLKTNGFDGLCNPDIGCGCGIDDLIECFDGCEYCQPGYRWECAGCRKKKNCEFGNYEMGCLRTTKQKLKLPFE